MGGQVNEALIGTVLQESYRITRVLGAGGMGTVYEGLQIRLGKRVAVKVLARELAAKPKTLVRFHREARITSQLGHPHIVNVFDFGVAVSGEPYMVMEYLEGEDLEQRLHRVGRIELPLVLHIVRQVASALTAAHLHGVVHRDLKPANVFLLSAAGTQGYVKVVDFGISKARDAATLLTGEHTLVGTPRYMSPEQAIGKKNELDHRTDQWALACIAYEMLEGRPVFNGDAVSAILFQVVYQDVPPLETTNVPSEVEQVLRKALSKRREDRFASVSEFARALHTAAGPQFGDAEPTPTPALTLSYGEVLHDPGPASMPVGRIDLSPQLSEFQLQPTTFALNTGGRSVTEIASRGWGKKAWMAVAVAGVVILLGTLLFLRLSATPAKPTASAPSAAATPGKKPATSASQAMTPEPSLPTVRAAPPAPGGTPAGLRASSSTLPEAIGHGRRRRPAMTPEARADLQTSPEVAADPEVTTKVEPTKPEPAPADEIGF